MATRDGKLTQQERDYAIERLKTSRQIFLDAVAGVSNAQGQFRTDDRWSVLEYAEHIAISEGALMGLVRRLLAAAAQPELMEKAAEMDERMFSSAFNVGIRLYDWKTKPMWSRRTSVSCFSARPIAAATATSDGPKGGPSSATAESAPPWPGVR